jgi:non-heme chloroperoxidase
MPTITTRDGATIAFTDEGSSTPVLLIPGICCSQRWWDRQREALVATNRVIGIDPRGIGASPAVPHGHRVARYAADVAELIERLDLRQVVVVGWSLGFSVSLALLELAGQDRLSGLVLVEGSPRLLNDASWRLGVADTAAGLRMRAAFRDRWDETIEALVRDVVAPSHDRDLPALLADARRADPDAIARLFWDHLHQDWRDVLPGVRVPALVVAGSASRVGDSVAAARYTAAAIPQARLEIFEAAGHALFREQPDRFNAMLGDFIARCAP